MSKINSQDTGSNLLLLESVSCSACTHVFQQIPCHLYSTTVDILLIVARHLSQSAVPRLCVLKAVPLSLYDIQIHAMPDVSTGMFVPPPSAVPVPTALSAPSTYPTEMAARTLSIPLSLSPSAEGGLYQDSSSLLGYNDTSSPPVTTTFGVVA